VAIFTPKAKKRLVYELGVLAAKRELLVEAAHKTGAADLASADNDLLRDEIGAVSAQATRCLDLLEEYEATMPKGVRRKATREWEPVKVDLVKTVFVMSALLDEVAPREPEA
jgi:hypothetical protein